MNKIDCMVRDALLRYPTLFCNRFDVFAEMMTNSCYQWNDRGELEYFRLEERPATVEHMLSSFRQSVAEAREKYGSADTPDYLAGLYQSFITREERALYDAEFIANHIDVYATTYCGTDHKQTWLWLWRTHRYGISEHWAINNKPDNIDEEWRLAIKEWLRQLMPPANGIMGYFEQTDGGPGGTWKALSEYATVYDWIGRTLEIYTTAEDRRQEEAQNKIAMDIIDRLRREG